MALFLVHSAIESEKDTTVGRDGGGGGVLRISSDRDDQMGGKNQNPKNSLDQMLTPIKSHSKFVRPSLGEFFFLENYAAATNLQIVLNTPKIPT